MTLSEIPKDRYESTLAAMRRRVFRAFLTMGALPRDRHIGYPREWGLGPIVREAHEAYGYTEERRRFQPTPADVSDFLPVMGAVARYRRADVHGERNYKLLAARAFDVPFWRLADQFGTSEKTLERWVNRAVEEILSRHLTAMSDTMQISPEIGGSVGGLRRSAPFR